MLTTHPLLNVQVETFPHAHESAEDYVATLRSALLYAKSVTLGPVHWPQSEAIMRRNRRIGCSMSGVAQFVAARGIDTLRDWCELGYAAVQERDAELSEWLGVPTSIKTTSIKPSGTVSLLAGATPGMHWPESRFYIRRVRLPASSELIPALREAGLHLEPAVEAGGGESDTLVVSFPIDSGEGVRTLSEVSMWEQLSMAAFLQRHWADNQVSCTVTFDPDTEGPQLAHALSYFQYQLKGVSMLPKLPGGAYEQMPYESISEATYNELLAALSGPVDLSQAYEVRTPLASETMEVPDLFCDTDTCALPTRKA